jgi:hypothetical protein
MIFWFCRILIKVENDNIHQSHFDDHEIWDDSIYQFNIQIRENVVTRLSHSISCSCSWECRHKIKSFSIMFVFVFVFMFKRMTHVSFLISFNFWKYSCSSRARASLMHMFRYQSLLTSQSSHHDRQGDEMKMNDVRKRNRMIVK